MSDLSDYMKISEREQLKLSARVKALTEALDKISAIRDSIVGSQQLNWSAHIYPLVAALDEAGFKGLPYPEAKKRHEQVFEENERLRGELERIRTAPRLTYPLPELGNDVS